LHISVTAAISTSTMYNAKTLELPGGLNKRACQDFHMLLYPVDGFKIIVLKGKTFSRVLYRDDRITDEWYAVVYSLFQSHSDHYKKMK
jgi:hypothetical protein